MPPGEMNDTNSKVTLAKSFGPIVFGKIVALDDGWYTNKKLKKFKIKFEDNGVLITLGKTIYCLWWRNSKNES